MTTTDKIQYSSNTTITCTLASLASTSSRGCLAVDNSTNLYDDAILTVAVKTNGSAPSSDKACYVYLYAAGADGVFTGSSAEAQGTDAAVTLDSPSNMRGPFTISCPAASTTYRLVVPSVAEIFGGVLPYKWGFVLQNVTGNALDTTEGNFLKEYTGIYYQNI